MSENARPVADQFMGALQKFEADGDLDSLVKLFADGAELSNLVRTESGPDAPRRFWTEYREAFGTVRSTFKQVIAGADGAALEWESEGTLPNGQPIRYSGVSLLGLADGRVARFATYYDTAAFVATTARDERTARPQSA